MDTKFGIIFRLLIMCLVYIFTAKAIIGQKNDFRGNLRIFMGDCDEKYHRWYIIFVVVCCISLCLSYAGLKDIFKYSVCMFSALMLVYQLCNKCYYSIFQRICINLNMITLHIFSIYLIIRGVLSNLSS